VVPGRSGGGDWGCGNLVPVIALKVEKERDGDGGEGGGAER
jgi:hypothetical protein